MSGNVHSKGNKMERKDHLALDNFAFNQEYNEVHQWLDEFYPKYMHRNPYKHWLHRHHLKAIKDEYGEFTLKYNVAYLHILFDFLMHFQIAFVPKDEKDLQEMFDSLHV
jgi:hypothetical protein